MKIGEAPRVTKRGASETGKEKWGGPFNPTSDDMRSNSVGLGGGTRFLLMGKIWLNPIGGCFKGKEGVP